MVVQANSTLAQIRRDVRSLTSSPGESSLPNAVIDQKINQYYSQKFPYSIKMDVLRTVYSIYTSPFVDTYPLDINSYQGIRAPVYFQGIRGQFFKDRQQFFNMWTRFPTQFFPVQGDGVTQVFQFTLGAPIGARTVTIGGVDINGNIVRITDDGGIFAATYGNKRTSGNLLLISSDVQGDIVPPIPPSSPIASVNPPAINPEIPTNALNVGTVNYVTGEFNISLPTPLKVGSQLSVWVYQYQAGRPWCLLFWNNEFTVRPIPNDVYKIDVEAYQVPTQFMSTTQDPTLNQWSRLIAIGAAVYILEDRQDVEGVNFLGEMYDREESITLERQATEEIGQRNTTMFADIIQSQNYGNFNNSWF